MWWEGVRIRGWCLGPASSQQLSAHLCGLAYSTDTSQRCPELDHYRSPELLTSLNSWKVGKWRAGWARVASCIFLHALVCVL